MPRVRKKPVNGAMPPFAERLRAMRIAAGLTQADLAERSGLGPRTISGLETGRSLTTQSGTKRALVDALGLDDRQQRWLFFGETPSPNGHENGADSFQPVPLIGRESDLLRVREAVAEPSVRLITVTGPGGIGKTRLAREVDRTGLGDPDLDRAYVELEDLRHHADVLTAIAAALHLTDRGGDARTVLRRALGDRHLLLILDNMDHLLAAAPDLGWLLDVAPGLTILATSRTPIGLPGERVMAIPPLPTEGDNAPAVRLFRQLAVRVNPDFKPGADGLRPVSSLCERLGGLPLGIELAAAQMETLTPGDLLAMMEHAGLDVLDGGARPGPERFASMDSAIRWSWDRLPGGERRILRNLAVFAGGFDIPAAIAVDVAISEDDNPGSRAVIAAAVMRLARRHVVARQPSGPSEPEPRFTILEPIRLFALDRLREAGGEQAARLAHARWALSRMQELDRAAYGPDPGPCIDRLERDYPNGRAAFDWALANGEYELAVELAVAMVLVWIYRDRNGEGRRRLEQLLDVGDRLPSHGLAGIRFLCGEIAYREGDFARVRDLANTQVAFCERTGVTLGMCCALLHLSAVEPGEDRSAALALIDRAREVLGDDLDWRRPFMQSWILGRQGVELHRSGDLAGARAAFEQAVSRRRAECNRNGVAIALAGLALVHEDMGAPQAAAAALVEAYPLAAGFGDSWMKFHTAWALLGLVIRHGLRTGDAAADRDLAAFAAGLRAALEEERRRSGIQAAGASEIAAADLPALLGPAPSLAEAMDDAWRIPVLLPILAAPGAPARPATPPLE